MNKKYILIFMIIIFTFSCTSISSKVRYENGDYIGSLKEIGNEIKRRKKITKEFQNEIVIRVQNIERILKQKQRGAMDDLNISITNFNLWKMGYILEKNPLIVKYTPISFSIKKNYEYLETSLGFMLNYILKNESRLNMLENLLKTLNDENILNTEYEILHKNYSKILADKYYEMAIKKIKENDLKAAKDMYYNSYKAYLNYDKNYKNSYSKYYKLIREIDIKLGKDFERIGKNLFHKGLLDDSKSNFKKAKNIYTKYNLEDEILKINDFLEKIKSKEEEKDFYNLYELSLKYLKEADEYKEKRDLVYEKRSLILSLDELNKALKKIENPVLIKMVKDKILLINKRLKN